MRDIDDDQEVERQRASTWELLSKNLWEFDAEEHKFSLESWITFEYFDTDVVEALLKRNRVEPHFCGFVNTGRLYKFATTDRDLIRCFVPSGGGLYIFTQLNEGFWPTLKVGQTGNFAKRISDHFYFPESRINRDDEVANYFCNMCGNPDFWPSAIEDRRLTLLLLPLSCKNGFLREALEDVLIQQLKPEMDPENEKKTRKRRNRR